MSDWGYVALGYLGGFAVIGSYCARIIVRARATRSVLPPAASERTS